MRTFQIPWPGTEVLFRNTLAQYFDFAQHVLDLRLPITIVSGLAMVRQALFIREKREWFVDAPNPARCFEEFISSTATISEWDAPQAPLLDLLFERILDACNQDHEG